LSDQLIVCCQVSGGFIVA